MRSTSNIKTYSGLRQLQTFDERFEYLALYGGVGHSTFGHDRYLNQAFYASNEWRIARRDVIARDNGNDLGVDGYPIIHRPVIHHIVPMTPEDIEARNPLCLDLDNLILTQHDTHNAIHYGTRALLAAPYEERRPDDHKLW